MTTRSKKVVPVVETTQVEPEMIVNTERESGFNDATQREIGTAEYEEPKMTITEAPAGIQWAVVQDWQQIKTIIDEMNTTSIQEMIDYSQSVITNRKRTEESELEQQMLEIQAKLNALRGSNGVAVINGSGKVKRMGKVIRNPDNPNEIYKGFGKMPQWLKTRLEPAQGNRDKEQEILNQLRG